MEFDYVSSRDEVVFIPVLRRRRIEPYPNEVRYERPVRRYYRPLP